MLSEKHGRNMPDEKVLGDVSGDDVSVCFEEVQITGFHFRSNFEAYMEQLAEAWVVSHGTRIVAQSACELRGRPWCHLRRCGKFCGIDIDYSCIGCAQIGCMVEGSFIDILGKLQASASRLGQAYDFFKPCGACCFEMDAGRKQLDC